MRRRLVLLLLAVACSPSVRAPSRPAAVEMPVPTVTPTITPAVAPVVATSRPAPRLVMGGDISWPSCPIGTSGALPKKPGKGNPIPGADSQFVVIGLTNGPGFYPNPCLAWEVAVARQRGLRTAAYAFTTLPNATQIATYGSSGPYSRKTALGRVQNAARAEARINVASIRSSGLRTPIVWLDVEPQPYLEPWGSDVAVNRAVIYAAKDEYEDAGFATGFYSSATPWRIITGGLQDPSPTWVSAGPRGEAAARAMCSAPSFSGGTPVLAQWWPDDLRDSDLTCSPQLAERFFAP